MKYFKTFLNMVGIAIVLFIIAFIPFYNERIFNAWFGDEDEKNN